MKKIFTLLTAFMASLTAMSAQAQLSEPIQLSDTTYLADGNNRTALYCTLADGTKLFFNSNMKTTYDASGYFFLTLNRIESEQQILNIPGEYVYQGHRTSLNRVLVINGEYLCDFQEITVPEGTEVFLLPATDALTTLRLPATMVQFSFAFSGKFKDLYLKSVYPPFWGTSSGYKQGLDQPMSSPLTGVNLHVPSMAMDLYSKTAPYKDGTLVAMTEPVEHIFAGYQPDITLTKTNGLAEDARLTVPRWYGVTSANNANGSTYGLFHNYETAVPSSSYDNYLDMQFFYPVRLTIDADKPVKLKKFVLDQDCEQYYFEQYTDPITGTNYKITPSTAIFKSPVTAEEIEMTYHLTDNAIRWKGTTSGDSYRFVSFPFDVKLSEITIPDFQYKSDMAVICMEFDAAKRATDASGSGYNWRQLSANEVLHANHGYLIGFYGEWAEPYVDYYGKIKYNYYSYRQTTLRVKAMDTENKQQLFTNGDVTVPLTAYPSPYKHRESWNHTGNPYPSFFDIHYLDFTAPITVFDGVSYYAFSPLDDAYYLYPNETFFVQCPEGINSITFYKDGRLHNDPGGLWQTKNAPARGMMQATEANPLRRVYNFILNGAAGHDRTRIVLNEEASTAYELEHDAAKMMSEGSTPQLYVLDGGVQYAIDERPLEEGIFSLGMIFPAAGSYTLSLPDNPDEQMEVVLTDLQTGAETNLTETAYTFDANSGSVANRFSVRFTKKGTNAIPHTNASYGEPVYYDLQGRILPSAPTQSGIYILRQGQTSHKVIVK